MGQYADEAETFGHDKVVEYLRNYEEIHQSVGKKIEIPPFSIEQDDVLKKVPSADSLYDKSESSSPVPASEKSDKIF